MPDFRLQPSFPIASVVDAASRNAQLQQQAREAGNQSLIEGLKSIGQVGESIFDTKKRVAQSLALGRQFDVPDEVSRTMAPEQLMQIGVIKKGNVDMNMLLNMLHPGSGATTPQVPATPVSGAPAKSGNGAILASDTTTTPMPDSSSPAPVAPSVPVPISAPPAVKPVLNKATADLAVKMYSMNKPESVFTNNNGTLTPIGTVPKGSKVLPSQSNTESREQDRLEQQARQGLQSVRGDTSIKNVESQRDAAITAYNRLKQIEYTGKPPNPVDYIDILGQIYKARTGTAPTDTVLRDARQQTVEGKFGRAYTFFTGQQAPATSKDIAANLKDMVAHMGLQADELHDGYMQVHGAEIFPTGLAPDRAAKLAKVARGKSFTDATGAKPEDYDPHVQAIQWAQAHPDDPRSGPIMQKAMQAKTGGQIGL